MSKLNKKRVETVLQKYQEPHLGVDLFEAKAVKKLVVKANTVKLDLTLGYPVVESWLKASLKQFLTEHFGEVELELAITPEIVSHAVQDNIKAHPQIKNIIAVGSGKGGVGKSTTAVNLALALRQCGARVGLLDADIYGPNQPQMLGKKQKPYVVDEKKFEPVEQYGLQTNSLGYLVDDAKAMIWRGPMVSGALQQLLNDTLWDNLDYLIVDLPPGTGDVQLTLAQKIPVSGAVIVTTPQTVATADAGKGIAMFQKVNIPVLGVIENMSYYICPCCSERSYLFGQGGGARLARQYEVPLLGEIPLNVAIREQSDQGKPIMIADPDNEIADQYREAALNFSAQLSLRPKNYTRKFPNIVVE